MKGNDKTVKSVAIIGAGAAGKHASCGVIFLLTRLSCIGSVTATAFEAEQYFDRIRVFERRETAGGTW
jgi:cation diffusion facilitator CzcD-associated flavoprotein CzcO